MKNSSFGVIIKVNNIDLCRNFYRNVSNLGNPVIDSSFGVEFQINNEFFLMLEKTDARFLEHESSATSWSCRIDNIDEFLDIFDYEFNTLFSKEISDNKTGNKKIIGFDIVQEDFENLLAKFKRVVSLLTLKSSLSPNPFPTI
jgi:hypothetical protein